MSLIRPQQVLGGLADEGEVEALLAGERVGGVGRQQLGEADDRVEGGPQLVAHRGQELALQAVGAHGLLAVRLELAALRLDLVQEGAPLLLQRLGAGDVAEEPLAGDEAVLLQARAHRPLDVHLAAVPGQEHGLHRTGRLAGPQPLEHRHAVLGLARRHDVEQGQLAGLLLRVPEGLPPPPVDVLHPPLAVDALDEVSRGLQELAEPALAGGEGVAGPPRFGDVEGEAEHVGGAGERGVQDVAVHPAPLLPLAGDQAHHPLGGLVPADAGQVAREAVADGRRQEEGEVAAGQLLRSEAERAGGGWIDAQQAPVEVVGAEEAEAVLEDVAVALLALAQGRLGQLAGGDVDEDADVPGEEVAVVVEGRAVGRHPDLPVAALEAVLVMVADPLRRGGGPRGLDVLPVAGVDGGQPPLAQGLVGRQAAHQAPGGVDVQKVPRGGRLGDAHGSQRQQRPPARLAAAQRALRLQAGGDVERDPLQQLGAVRAAPQGDALQHGDDVAVPPAQPGLDVVEAPRLAQGGEHAVPALGERIEHVGRGGQRLVAVGEAQQADEALVAVEEAAVGRAQVGRGRIVLEEPAEALLRLRPRPLGLPVERHVDQRAGDAGDTGDTGDAGRLGALPRPDRALDEDELAGAGEQRDREPRHLGAGEDRPLDVAPGRELVGGEEVREARPPQLALGAGQHLQPAGVEAVEPSAGVEREGQQRELAGGRRGAGGDRRLPQLRDLALPLLGVAPQAAHEPPRLHGLAAEQDEGQGEERPGPGARAAPRGASAPRPRGAAPPWRSPGRRRCRRCRPCRRCPAAPPRGGS